METLKTENEIIAEFMGFSKTGTFYETKGIRHDKYKSDMFGYTYAEEWAFDSKWDWLMRVVDKIESLGYAVKIKRKDCEVDGYPQDRYYDLQIDSLKIKSVYKAVVQFIKWYNENKPKK